MNQKALKTLEYDKIINQLTEYAASPLGKALCQNLSPSSDLEEVRTWQAQTTDAVTRIRLKGSVSFSGIRDIGDSLKRLDIGSSLSIPELLSISSLLTVAARAKAYGRHDGEDDARGTGEPQDDFDSLEPLFAGLEPLTPLNNEIKRCILSEDEVADDASPGLSHVRRSMKVTADRIHTQLNSILNSNRSYLQDAVITMRDGRYCLPVKSEYKNQVSGMVHDQSATGSTLFIEPMAIIRLNNEMRELEIQEQKEIEAVLASLSNQAAPCTEELRMDMELLAQLDFIFAKAGLARHYKCSAPVFNDKGYIHIKDGRHPLLNPQAVVPINVWLGREFDLLIVTGPNTGGKTVSLKTVGLFTLMGQSGLHIPAWEGSELAVFDQVFADIGDEQSIEQSLSTFSSHMTNIVDIMKNADADALVLFDELGAGTDPTEGAALAISILNTLHERDVTSVSTTHYSELKEYALVTRGVVNASVEFDVATLRPTFRLLIGVPGKSNAFEIARRLGLSEDIIEASKKLIENEAIRFEETLIKIEEKRKKTEAEHEEILRLRRQIEDMKAEMADEREKARAASAEIIERAQEEASAIVRDTRQETEEIYKEIRYIQETTAQSVKDNKKLEALRRKIKNQEKNIFDMYKIVRPEEDEELDIDDIKTGMKVHVKSLHKEGEVVKIMPKDNSVMVQTDNMKLKVGLADLTKSKAIAKPKEKKISYKSADRHTMDTKLDLRSKNGEESLYLVDKMISDAVVSGTHQLMIVHGKGTGKLRQVIHAYLKDNSLIKDFRLGAPNEGGSGVTVVEL